MTQQTLEDEIEDSVRGEETQSGESEERVYRGDNGDGTYTIEGQVYVRICDASAQFRENDRAKYFWASHLREMRESKSILAVRVDDEELKDVAPLGSYLRKDFYERMVSEWDKENPVAKEVKSGSKKKK